MYVEDQTNCWKYVLDDGTEVISVEHVKDTKTRSLLDIEVPPPSEIRSGPN